MCEVWFRIDKAGEYDGMLAWLAKQGVFIGLHHWGIVDDTYKTNIASTNTTIRQKTLQQIKDTIDIGERIECAYVNIHCGAQASEEISFGPTRQVLMEDWFAEKMQAETIFFESMAYLSGYAKEKGVLLTVETLPGLEARDTRLNTYEPGNISYVTILEAGKRGSFVANDITHTATQLFLEDTNPQSVWKNLMAFSQAAAPFTRLLHINTVSQPFVGVDSHDGLLPADFARNVFPSRAQIKQFLALFARRDDVFVIPEPHTHMQENYQALVQLVSEV